MAGSPFDYGFQQDPSWAYQNVIRIPMASQYANISGLGVGSYSGLGVGSYSGSLGQGLGQLLGGYSGSVPNAADLNAQFSALLGQQSMQQMMQPEPPKAQKPADPEVSWLKSRVKEIEWRP